MDKTNEKARKKICEKYDKLLQFIEVCKEFVKALEFRSI